MEYKNIAIIVLFVILGFGFIKATTSEPNLQKQRQEVIDQSRQIEKNYMDACVESYGTEEAGGEQYCQCVFDEFGLANIVELEKEYTETGELPKEVELIAEYCINK